MKILHVIGSYMKTHKKLVIPCASVLCLAVCVLIVFTACGSGGQKGKTKVVVIKRATSSTANVSSSTAASPVSSSSSGAIPDIDYANPTDNTEPVAPSVASIDTSPKIAAPYCKGAESIIYNVNVKNLGADSTGRIDSTPILQAAIDAVSAKGGGTVYIPAGKYRLTSGFSIPNQVNLVGDWQSPDNGGLGKGTILLIYAGRGVTDDNAPAPFYVEGTIKDLSFWYPQQSPTVPVAYPYTISCSGATEIFNITFYNSFKGIYATGAACLKVRNIYGTFLNTGVTAGGAADIPRTEVIRVSTKYWSNSGLPGAPKGSTLDTLIKYTRHGLTALNVGRQDWGYLYDLWVENANIALLNYAPDGGNIAIGKLVTNDVNYGVYVSYTGQGLMLSDSNIGAYQAGVYFAPSTPNFVSIVNTTFTGTPKYDVQITGGLKFPMNLNNCTFGATQVESVNYQGSMMNITNCNFKAAKSSFQIGSIFSSGILMGNLFTQSKNLFTTISDSDMRISRSDADNSVLKMPAYSYQFAAIKQPTVSRIYNVKDFGAKGTDSTDDSKIIQSVLNLAGKNGGGTVVLPAGNYRIDNPLTVPTNVELRGSFEKPTYERTINGTVLSVYYGAGKPNDALITLSKGSGARGFAVYYPEQGATNKSEVTDASGKTVKVTSKQKIKTYPWMIRGNQDCWIYYISPVNAYNGFDLMTNNCDNTILADSQGCILNQSVQVGHGSSNVTLQDIHFNPAAITQSNLTATPTGYGYLGADGLAWFMLENSVGFELADAPNLKFFNSFNIFPNIQLKLVKDPYTGKSFHGTLYDVAFDGSHNGVVGENGCSATLNMINSMYVCNSVANGENPYCITTKPNFTGTISIYNSDIWDQNSRVADVQGGTVNLVMYYADVVNHVECSGGTLNVLDCFFGIGDGTTPITFKAGTKGKVVGCHNAESSSLKISISKKANVSIDPNYNGTISFSYTD